MLWSALPVNKNEVNESKKASDANKKTKPTMVLDLLPSAILGEKLMPFLFLGVSSVEALSDCTVFLYVFFTSLDAKMNENAKYTMDTAIAWRCFGFLSPMLLTEGF